MSVTLVELVVAEPEAFVVEYDAARPLGARGEAIGTAVDSARVP